MRGTEGGEGGWTGGRWSDLEGGAWLRESWGAKKCDGNERWGMGSGRRVKGMMRCGVGAGQSERRSAARGGAQGKMRGAAQARCWVGVQGGMWSEARGEM